MKTKDYSSDFVYLLDGPIGTDAELGGEEEDAKFIRMGTNQRQAEIMKCYLNTGLAKLAGVKEYLNDLMHNDIKLLVFAHHIEVLNGVEEEVKKARKKYIRIDGQTDVKKRHENVKLFQEDENVKIAILSVTAAGIGLTLTAASTVVFAEMHWTPAVMLQAEDRVHRIGQQETTCVNYHYLYGEGTLDSLLYDKLQSKIAVVSEILEGKAETLNVESSDVPSNEVAIAITPEKQTGSVGKKSIKSNTTASSKASGKPHNVHQITSYFKKKENQIYKEEASIDVKNIDSRGIAKTVIDEGLWSRIDEGSESVNIKEKGKVDNDHKSISSITEVLDDNDLRGYSKELNPEDAQLIKEREEWKKFEDGVFYACLEEIYQNERKKKEEEINTKDIRTFFDKEAEIDGEQEPNLDEELKDNTSIDSQEELAKLWEYEKDDGQMTLTHGSKKMETAEDGKIEINTSKCQRISLEVDGRSNRGVESRQSGNKKRSIESLDADLANRQLLESGITSNITKKMKEDS